MKTSHFLLFKIRWSVSKLVELFISEIVKLHGVLISIVSNRDPRFTSHFWHSFQEALDTELHMSYIYFSGGKRSIQTLEAMLRACCLNWKGSWAEYVPLAEFIYNNSYQASIGIAPFKALYSRPCRSPLC